MRSQSIHFHMQEYNIFEGLEVKDITLIEEAPRNEKLRQLSHSKDMHLNETLEGVSQWTGYPILEEFKLTEKPESEIPIRLIHEYQCLPLQHENKDLITLITVWPPDENMNKWIYASCGKKPQWFLGNPDKVIQSITQHFGIGSDTFDDDDDHLIDETNDDIDDPENQDAAIIKFVNEVVEQAVSERSTDIHFEPYKDSLRIRFRIDGQLIPANLPENLARYQNAIISRLKIMARLNISEKRRPQDGRITHTIGKNSFDMRISTIPTMYGESVSLRLLKQQDQPFSIRDLGFLSDDEKNINKILEYPHGIILVTGPTGSGKSTSLSAFIRRINRPERRIITVEDPVEYEIAGVNQTQINTEVGLDFANALRSILRQDPDVIMVGEIRDKETADIAIRASLTGHLVMSTLHTNNAAGALTRLIDMQIEPFLIASSVELIIAQRLVRKLCTNCSKTLSHFAPGFVESCLVSLGIDPIEANNKGLLKDEIGCEACRTIGYVGRIGICEVLRVDDELKQLVIENQSAAAIHRKAIEKGMRDLQHSAWEQAKKGTTTLKEIMQFAELKEE